MRDFLGILVPVLIAFVAVTQWLEQYREIAIGALGVFALAQAIIVIWGLLSRWDEQMAYALRAMRDSYDLKTNWERLGKGEVADIEIQYRLTSEQQRIVDSHDVQHDITERDQQRGMRSALIAYQRKCAGCDNIPKTTRPKGPTENPCVICGGI